MAATRARTELAAAAPTSQDARSVDAPRQAASPADTSAASDQTPARRTTTRTRKLPSRLLPSPSPPPSRPTSLYNAAKHTKGGRDVSDPSADASPAANAPPSLAAATPKLRRAAKADSEDAVPDSDPAADRDGNLSSEDLGPGKRKRRPSSMYKPPSTLTSVDTPSPAASLATIKAKKKGRSLSPDNAAQKAQSPASSTVQAKFKGRLSKGKFDATPSAKKGEAPADRRGEAHGDDSEAELEVARHSSAPKKARLDDSEDLLDLSPPPLLPRDGSARVRMPTHFTQPTFIRGGRVSVSPEASAKRPVKFGIRDFNRPIFQLESNTAESHEPPRAATAASRGAAPKRCDMMSSSPISAGVAKFDSELSAPLTYVPFRCAARNTIGFHNRHVIPFASEQMDEDDEEEDDDENDFHQAMLDADFDFFDSQKTDANVVNVHWDASQRAATEETADVDDTPATTPRSPQSGCDLPSPGSPRCKTEEEAMPLRTVEEKTGFNPARDSVFVHALPTTQVGADKPCQHAGSLTLSLPYTPGVAVSSPQLCAMELDSDGRARAAGVSDAPRMTQTGTPVLQRRKHAGIADGAHGLAPLKLGADLMERSASNTAPYMQLSPMIEMDSPLLSPGLTLGMHGKGTDLPSPFVIGVDSLPELEHPAPLDLPPAEGSTTPKTFHPEVPAPELPAAAEAPATSEVEADKAPEATPAPKVAEPNKAPVKAEKPAARRPALPPPRQIRFTTLETPCSDASERKTQPAVPTTTPSGLNQQQQTLQHQTSARATTSPKAHPTPDLVHSGSSSPDSVSDSPSPMSQAGSSATGDAEVETILFGPPEKLDLHELDHAWNGAKGAQHEAAVLRRAQETAQLHPVDVDVRT